MSKSRLRSVFLTLVVIASTFLAIPILVARTETYELITGSWEIAVSKGWSVFGSESFCVTEVNRIELKCLQTPSGGGDRLIEPRRIFVGTTSVLWRGGLNDSIARLIRYDSQLEAMSILQYPRVNKLLKDIRSTLQSSNNLEYIAEEVDELTLIVLKDKRGDG